MTVLAFKRPEEPKSDGWLGGEAICIGCRHRWMAVAPVGAWQLDCPECKSAKGIFTLPVGADTGDAELRCNCGCPALTAYRSKGHVWLRCMSCGTDQTEAYFG